MKTEIVTHESQIFDAAAKTRRLIARLYYSYCPLREIRLLEHQLEIALQNDLARFKRGEKVEVER